MILQYHGAPINCREVNDQIKEWGQKMIESKRHELVYKFFDKSLQRLDDPMVTKTSQNFSLNIDKLNSSKYLSRYKRLWSIILQQNKRRFSETRAAASMITGQNGFTMIEVIIVLILFSIFSAMAVCSTSGLADAAFKAGVPLKVTAHLRYVQARNMGDQVNRYYIAFYGSTYRMKKYNLLSGGGSVTMALPGETDATITLGEGITITPRNIGFDMDGTPLTGNDPGSMSIFSYPGKLGLSGCNVNLLINNRGRIYSEKI